MTTPDIPPHVLKLIQHLQTLSIQAPPSPWRHITSHGIGGLLAVGYAEYSDLLLVISTQGRGIFDCILGTKIARDYTNPDEYYDEISLQARGFGPIEGQMLHIAGLFGGGLPNSTRDGWHLNAVPLPWPHNSIIIEMPFRSMYQDQTSVTKVGEDSMCELRAYGFSPTGQSFIIATSCDLRIFSRSSK